MLYKRDWNDWFNDLLCYKDRFGDCLAPSSYITENGFKLGKWVVRQRGLKNKMSLCRKEKLDFIGFVWYAKPFLTYEHVFSFIEGAGYKLLSKNFISIKHKLKIRCDKQHVYEATFAVFRKGHRCPECAGLRQYTYNEIKEIFESIGYVLLSKTYKNNKQKLKFICNKGHTGAIMLNSVLQGHGCWRCAQEDKAVSLESVKETFSSVGLELLSQDYSNCRQQLKYICKKCGHIGAKTYNAAQQGHGCIKCGSGPVSVISIEWLSGYGDNVLMEYTLKDLKFRVDGFDPKTNTVYEFLGDFWHGNPDIYDPVDINPINKKTYGKLYKETIERLEKIKDARYNLIYIWEVDFRACRSEEEPEELKGVHIE